MSKIIEIFTQKAKSERGLKFSLTLSKYKWDKFKRFLKTGKLK